MRKLKAARYGYLLISLLFCLSAFAYWLIPARSPPVTCWDTTMRSEQNWRLQQAYKTKIRRRGASELTACGSQKWSGSSSVCGIIVVKRKITANLAVIFLKMVDLIGFEPTTPTMRTNQKPCFVLIFSRFRHFRLECKWSCGPYCPL